jgi:hypothetical protein
VPRKYLPSVVERERVGVVFCISQLCLGLVLTGRPHFLTFFLYLECLREVRQRPILIFARLGTVTKSQVKVIVDSREDGQRSLLVGMKSGRDQ